ncbi:MAG: formylglycine-generating enzyme family protein [Thermoanaerobaculia bacterium]|nr:formylglycine-generating enzyme family protein [Thermoanaerobaculia bacterium]
MKTFALFALLLGLPALAPAQCYTALREKGKALVQQKKYDEAIAAFRNAKACKTDKPANGDSEMDALIKDAVNRKPKPAPSGPTDTQKKADDALYKVAKAANTIAAYQAYLNECQLCSHAGPARAAIRRLKKPGTAGTTSTPPAVRCDGCPEMVFVQGGRFTMGCQSSARDGECYDYEKPPHEVTVRDFYIGKYEVTQAEWRAVMGSDPPDLYNKGCDRCPVENVSWDDAQEFIRRLNARTGKKFRLPTEAEWEYAARGGNQSRGYLYSGSNNIGEVAWYQDNYQNGSTFGAQKTTRPAGTRKANELGIHDMSGNVWEWVEDDWHDNYQGAPTDGRAWVDRGSRGGARVYRGGLWSVIARYCRAASRYSCTPAYRYGNHGFRLALQF